jgi:hypothetical protein
VARGHRRRGEHPTALQAGNWTGGNGCDVGAAGAAESALHQCTSSRRTHAELRILFDLLSGEIPYSHLRQYAIFPVGLEMSFAMLQPEFDRRCIARELLQSRSASQNRWDRVLFIRGSSFFYVERTSLGVEIQSQMTVSFPRIIGALQRGQGPGSCQRLH